MKRPAIIASSGRGNPLTVEQQWRKLELVTAVARKVWNGDKSKRPRYHPQPYCRADKRGRVWIFSGKRAPWLEGA